jgi:hypothetical protein
LGNYFRRGKNPEKILQRAGKLFFAEGAGPSQNIFGEGQGGLSKTFR